MWPDVMCPKNISEVMVYMGSNIGASLRRAIVWVAVMTVLLGAWDLPRACAQSLFGVMDPASPFVFSPGLRGEARVTPIWIGISGGNETVPALGLTWNLREQFNMTRSQLFLDTMLKFSAGRFSVRGHYEPRELVGRTNFQNTPYGYMAEARIDYSGIRVGGDVDVFLPYGIYFGANLDYDLYRPFFTESIQTAGGKKIIGESPLTWGVHAVVNPVSSYYGVSGMFEVRARWPLSGAEVTDLELAAGVRTPETILGSMALRFGWRHTKISFGASQRYNSLPVSTDFDAVLDGWFGQFCYYY